MLLIYVPKLTNRIGYTFNLVFKTVLKTDYFITTNKDYFSEFQGEKLSYGQEFIPNSLLHIYAVDLLSQTSIEFVDLKSFKYRDIFAFFPTPYPNSPFPFDIFAAIFYLVSRYEEYLPHQIDKHSRFDAKESILYEHNLLQRPVVNLWIQELADKIKECFPEFNPPKSQFKAILTIDIDNAYAFKSKVVYRTIGGYFKSLFSLDFKAIAFRTRVLVGRSRDPFDSYNFLLAVIKKYRLRAIFFILYGKYGKYDTNLSNNNPKFHTLLKYLGDYAKVGIHPSYASFENPQLMKKEIAKLSETMHKPIIRNRFHFIRFRLPDSFRVLIDNGIEHDYSMGYSSEIGFRAGICTPYNFYDLENNYETNLLLHPFAAMDSTLRYYKNIDETKAFEAFKQIIDEVKNVNGSFYHIWHNESLGSDSKWSGWKKVFIQVIEYAFSLQKNNE